MDEFLKILAVEKWKLAIDFYIAGKYAECFRTYRALYSLIGPYEFEMKAELIEITEIISEYIQNLKGKPLDLRAEIEYKQSIYEFKKLMSVYMDRLPQSYSQLGLWFKVTPHYDDIERQASIENFNSDITEFTVKKEELSKLKTKEILEFMKRNAVHDCYARYRMDNAVPSTAKNGK